ncbi:MAG TPA: N-methyl-L-tryptophan oxidase [Thermoanaerobaculia bacterium]|nr:N-methyl-L-tryptophan oxidase [Thermoanaerobaculia bacterium]
MGERYEVIVLGVGAMGAAACSALARRGHRVLGIERFDVPHAFGSSGGQSRLIRLAYHEHPDYVPLLRRAYAAWDELAERSGIQVLHRTGLAYFGLPAGQLIAGTLRSAEEHGVPCESLDLEQARRRFPRFSIPETFATLFEPEGGLVLSERAIAAFVDETLRAGGRVRARERVLEWSAGAEGVRVRTDRGSYQADQLVIAAGAWAPALMRDLGVELRVTRQVLGWVWPDDPASFEIGAFPCWAIEDDAPGFEGIYYGFPLLPADRFAGERGIKLAHHYLGPTADPETLDRHPTPADEEDFRAALRRYLPAAAEAPTLAAKVCMYTATPDEHFVVDRHPLHPRLTIGCGFSGHGFKFGPVIGEALADLATNGSSDLPIGFLGLQRFGAP